MRNPEYYNRFGFPADQLDEYAPRSIFSAVANAIRRLIKANHTLGDVANRLGSNEMKDAGFQLDRYVWLAEFEKSKRFARLKYGEFNPRHLHQNTQQ